MSANRCFRAWYDASGRPNEYRSKAHVTVMSKARCIAPTDSALSTSRTWMVIRAWFQKATAASRSMPRRRARRPLAWKARADDSRLR